MPKGKSNTTQVTIKVPTDAYESLSKTSRANCRRVADEILFRLLSTITKAEILEPDGRTDIHVLPRVGDRIMFSDHVNGVLPSRERPFADGGVV